MANLLDQASIVLTPTAYDNGKVLCAKPSEAPYGDFDFSRNSAATRVNAQGLVENVQILSSNLVQNGDFSEEGVQEVSNGSFSQEGVELLSQPVNLVSDFEINGGGVIVDADTFETFGGNFDGIKKVNLFVVGKSYKLVIEGDTTSSGFTIGNNQASGNEYGSGFGTHYFTATINSVLWLRQKTAGTTNITSFSIREVGQDWSFSGEAEITAQGGRIYSSDGSFSAFSQPNPLIVGKYYKLTFDVISSDGAGLTINNGDLSNIPTPLGTNTHYFQTSLTSIEFKRYYGITDVTITNISVKEVGMDWNLGSGWSIGEDKLTFDSNDIIGNPTQYSTASIDANPFVIGKKYRATLTDLEILGGSVEFKFGREYNTNPARPILTSADNGTYVDEFVAVSVSNSFTINNGGVRAYGSIGSVSIIEITDDTNLPRINYEGFSYQDALGSENIDLTAGNTLDASAWGSVTTSGVSYLAGAGDISYYNTGFVVTAGLTYKLSFTLSGYTGSSDLGCSTAGGVSTSARLSENGVYTEYFTASSSTQLRFFGRSINTGVFSNVSVKEYSGQEVVPNSGCGSWLFEPQSTNLIPYSEDFSSGNWTDNNVGTTPIITTGFLSPDGTNNATKISNQNNDSLVQWRSVTPAGGTKSIYAKTTGGNGQIFLLGGTNTPEALFDVTENWQRFTLNDTDSTHLYAVDFRGASTLSEVVVWGAQAEALSYATSYIPTENNPNGVTRNQDVCTNGGSLATINSTEGVLYAEIAALANGGVGDRYITLSSGNDAVNTIQLLYHNTANRVNFRVRKNGSLQVNISDFTFKQTDNLKIAVKYKENDFALWINGLERATDTSGETFTIGTLQKIQFNSGASNFYGKIKALAVWKEALSDQELAELTYPTPTDPTFSLDFDTIAEQFTFTRGSEATYVDAQGLIQSTNEIGSELILNGSFDSDTAWTKTGEATISGGYGNIISTTGASSELKQTILQIGVTYKYSVEVVSISSGGIQIYNGSPLQIATSIGTYTGTFVATNAQFRLIRNGVTNGSIDNVSVKEVISATNTPRLDYSTGAEAFLLEPQSTNLVTHSEDFTQSWWFASTADVVLSTNLSPNGTQNAYKVTYGASGNRLGGANFSLPNTPHTNSIYMRKISGSGVVDFKDQVGLSNIINLTEDWQRYSITQTLVDGTARLYVDLQTSGDVVEVWGAQQEALPYSTSYIPTSGSTVTRNQETCINATPEINSEEGVLYFEGSALVETTTGNRHLTITDGTNNNRLYFYYSLTGQFAFAAFVGGVLQANIKYDGIITNNSKVACVWKDNDYSLWVDGVEVGTDTSASVWSSGTLNTLNFAEANGVNSPFFGNTKDLQVYTKALSDAELIKLTT